MIVLSIICLFGMKADCSIETIFPSNGLSLVTKIFVISLNAIHCRWLWGKIVNTGSLISFRDENKKSMIPSFMKMSCLESMFYSFNEVIPNYAPISLIKIRILTLRTRNISQEHREHSLSYFSFIWNTIKTRVLNFSDIRSVKM